MEFGIELFLSPVAGVALINWLKRLGINPRLAAGIGVPLIIGLVYATAVYGTNAHVEALLRGLWVSMAAMGVWDTAQAVQPDTDDNSHTVE